MKKLLYLIVPILMFGFISCSNENDDMLDSTTDIKREKLEFTYKGTVYSTDYYTEGDDVIFDNKSVGELFDRLQDDPKIVTWVKIDGSVELTDDLDALINKSDSENKLKNWSYPSVPWDRSVSIVLYEHSDKRGKSLAYYASGQDHISVPSIAENRPIVVYPQIDLNSQVSSFFITATVGSKDTFYNHYCRVRLNDNINFTGDRNAIYDFVTPKGTTTTYTMNDLSKWVISSGLFHKKRTWNDRASSVEVAIRSDMFPAPRQ